MISKLFSFFGIFVLKMTLTYKFKGGQPTLVFKKKDEVHVSTSAPPPLQQHHCY